MNVEFSPQAGADLRDIWLYIAHDSVENAGRYLRTLEDSIRRIGESPGVGRERDDIPITGVRSHAVRSHVILYRVVADEVQIHRVIHSARDVRRIRLNEG